MEVVLTVLPAPRIHDVVREFATHMVNACVRSRSRMSRRHHQRPRRTYCMGQVSSGKAGWIARRNREDMCELPRRRDDAGYPAASKFTFGRSA